MDNTFIKGESVKLKYEKKIEGCADHIHFYLDGQRIKPFDGTFTNLTPGQHEICIAATTKDHKPLGLEDHGEVNTACPCFDKTTDTTSGVFDVVPVLFSPSLVVFLSEGKPTCYGQYNRLRSS